MGKGDKKSKKGKRFQHSFGKTRKRNKGLTISSRKKVETKPKPVEHKKPAKPEPEIVKPVAIVETKVEEIVISRPQISEIKEEVKLPTKIETAVPEIPKIVIEPVTEDPKAKEPVKEVLKIEIKEDEKPSEEAPKKRGRPKKKKDE